MAAVRTVVGQPAYVALGALSFIALTLLYLWSSQVLIVNAGGISLLVEPSFVVAAIVMSSIFGVLIPLQAYAVRRAKILTAQTGGTALGALLGMTSMSCCAPVLLPSFLSLLGFSGVTILSVNLQVHRFWLPLATVSTVLLAFSLLSTVRSLEETCRVDPGRSVAGLR